MHQADIYLLHSPALSDQLVFCCKLVDKAYQQGCNMHIQTREAYQNEALNERLWDFRADSFLPHAVGQSQYAQYPITIDIQSNAPAKSGHRDLLILLSAELPSNAMEFGRIGMIIGNDAEEIQRARQTYRQLTAQNLLVNIHDFRRNAR